MKEERFPHTRKPLHRWRLWVVGWGELQSHRGECSNRGAEGKAERFPHRGSVPTQNSPAREACLLTRWGGWGLGAEVPASEIRCQGDDCCWLHEQNLKGASAPQLAGRESGKKSRAAKDARNFFLSLCFVGHEERVLRQLLKGAPEMGVSFGYQHGPERQA